MRGRGGDGRGPYTRWSKAAGGAVLGWQDALDGIASRRERGRAYSLAPLWSPRSAGGRGWPHPRLLSTMWRGVDLCFRGIGRTWYRGTRCGCGRCVGGCVGRLGCGDWQGREASTPGAAGVGRPARRRWRSPRHADGADPAPRPWWPGVRQHPVPQGWRADGHAPPRRMTRCGVGHDPAPFAPGATGRRPARSARHADSTDPAPRP